MEFRVSARTILQLGGELISTDGIAFYELIKNAFDAGSPNVVIRVAISLPHAFAIETLRRLRELERRKNTQKKKELNDLKSEVASQIDTSAPHSQAVATAVAQCDTVVALIDAIEQANFIEFEDTGHGMSSGTMEEVYLTVGTPFRRDQRKSLSGREKILGEKGIGRLSAIRVGKRLEVLSTQSKERAWNILNINWRDFEDPHVLLEDVPVPPLRKLKKDDAALSGTVVRVSALTSEWTVPKLRTIATDDLSKFSDPFTPEDAFPILLTFNSDSIPLSILDDLLFEHAHAIVDAQLCFDSEEARRRTKSRQVPVFFGNINYERLGRMQAFQVRGIDLLQAAGVNSEDELAALGPFSVRFYWFNRLYATAIDGIGTIQQVRDLIRQWAGGLMVFRDGIRVQPYAAADDDWLALDREAFRSGGFKLNRQQVIGKVDISSWDNPALIDQTNREGLCECPEIQVLKRLVNHLMRMRFKRFLESAEAEAKQKAPVSFQDLGDRFQTQQERLDSGLKDLRRVSKDNPQLNLQPVVTQFAGAFKSIAKTLSEAETIREGLEEKRSRFLRLAGVGLMVEILAHELHRSVSASVTALSNASAVAQDRAIASSLRTSEVQLKSLAKRLSVLDRLTTSGRQRKQEYDAAAAVNEIFNGRKAQFSRHGITATVKTQPAGTSVRVKFVKGMFYQLIENLTENSVYWLGVKGKYDPSVKPKITVTVCESPLCIRFHDNGTGTDSDDIDQIFLPFFSLKQDNEGKGLGLYISREIADYHGATLSLDSRPSREDGRLHTFVLDMSNPTKRRKRSDDAF